MSKKLYLPDHVAQKVKENRAKQAVDISSVPATELSDAPLDRAYIKSEDRVLDPSLIEKPLRDRLPQPTGWRVLVMPYQGKAKTAGGLYVPDEVRERESVATVVAYVMKVGPLAYKDPGKFGDGSEPWCKEGQWVCIGRYAGSRFKIEGGEVRIINDDEVIATILDPDDVKHV
jgi:co-chaperonin GroES (HSP10)